MNAKKYYVLLEEYNKLISQKEFNEHLCNKGRLQEVERTLVSNMKASLNHILADYIEERKYGIVSSRLEMKYNQIANLISKVEKEDILAVSDYEDTYYKPRFIFGLTIQQTLVLFVVAVIISLFVNLVVN